MTTIEFKGKCPSCGYEFKLATLAAGPEPTMKGGGAGVCCECGEVLRIIENMQLAVMTAKQFLDLAPSDSINCMILVSQIRVAKKRKAAVSN